MEALRDCDKRSRGDNIRAREEALVFSIEVLEAVQALQCHGNHSEAVQ